MILLATLNSLSLRAWELNFNHGEIVRVDNCKTGFLRLKGDLRANNRPCKSPGVTHIGRGVCVCVGACGRLTSSAFPLYDDGGSDKLSNVNTDTVKALISFLSLSNRDLKIENLLLDEQDNIKLIGNARAPT